jgi:hypothetical protein
MFPDVLATTTKVIAKELRKTIVDLKAFIICHQPSCCVSTNSLYFRNGQNPPFGSGTAQPACGQRTRYNNSIVKVKRTIENWQVKPLPTDVNLQRGHCRESRQRGVHPKK